MSAKGCLSALLALVCALPVQAQEIRAEDPVAALELSLQAALARAANAVVAIRVDREPEAPPKAAPSRGLPSLRLPGAPLEDVFAKRPASAWCSGFVVEASGIILTTHFNVSGKVKSIKVLLPDGREFEATLLGYNGTADLAALKIEAEGLTPLAKSPLGRIQAGLPVLALGRAPDGRGLTVNPGIISASSRLIGGKGVQTDAKLNYGNVGGPLVDLEGRLVGPTCKVDVKYASSRGQNSGVGFAVTHDRVFEVLADLKAGKNEAEPRRPFLGIEFEPNSKVAEGVELKTVQAGGAAERAGLKPRDVIIAFDGVKILSFDSLKAAILRKAPGDHVKIRYIRGEESLEADCELGWAPGE